MQIGIMHKLIDVSLASHLKLAEANTIEEQYARNAVLILSCLASIDMPVVYIPGETTNQARDRKRFMQWGGMATLILLSHHSKLNELSIVCEGANIKNLKLKLHEDLVKMIKTYLGNKNTDSKEVLNSHGNAPKLVNTEEVQSQDIAFPE